MNKIITEITPLSEKDCFYLVDRYKDRFTYPVHKHEEYELNFVADCNNARRIVGDSVEVLGDYDLVLVGNGIEHGWEQYECKSDKIREITIQFSRNLFGEVFLAKTQLAPIRKMLDQSSKGIAFSLPGIMRVYSRLEKLTAETSGVYRVVELLSILYELAEDDGYRTLSSEAFSAIKSTGDSRRVQKVQEYVEQNYRSEIRLSDLANIAGMTPTAFSRFFKLRTGRSISDYLIDIRLGHATRALVDSTASIAEICYDCGFNNISNFNRIFKKKKGSTPKIFRDMYQHHKTVV